MSQIFGYLCSNQSLTAAVMEQVGGPLQAASDRERTALGIGWLQDGRSLLRKHPRKRAATIDIPDLLSDVPTRALVGHVRHRDEGKPRSVQPFRFRNWVYAQRGELPLVEEDHRELRGSIPDHVARNIQGASVAEVLFHQFFAEVESRYSITPEHELTTLYVETLQDIVARVEWRLKTAHDQPRSLQLIAVTERFLAAINIGESLSYRFLEGIEVDSEKPLFAGHRPKKVHHDKFRALLISSGVEEPEWETLPDRSVLWVGADWSPRIASLSPTT
jgi:predicted glutamine amidotransferase